MDSIWVRSSWVRGEAERWKTTTMLLRADLSPKCWASLVRAMWTGVVGGRRSVVSPGVRSGLGAMAARRRAMASQAISTGQRKWWMKVPKGQHIIGLNGGGSMEMGDSSSWLGWWDVDTMREIA
jgi:hypothetical protein